MGDSNIFRVLKLFIRYKLDSYLYIVEDSKINNGHTINEESKNIVNTFIKMFSTAIIEIKRNFIIKSTILLSSI